MEFDLLPHEPALTTPEVTRRSVRDGRSPELPQKLEVARFVEVPTHATIRLTEGAISKLVHHLMIATDAVNGDDDTPFPNA